MYKRQEEEEEAEEGIDMLRSALAYLVRKEAGRESKEKKRVRGLADHDSNSDDDEEGDPLRRLHGALVEKEWAQARFLSILNLLVVGQFTLDGNWLTARKLPGMEEPTWAEWSKTDVALAKRSLAHSRLPEKSGIASATAEHRDDDYLLKKRSLGKGGKKGNDKEEDGE